MILSSCHSITGAPAPMQIINFWIFEKWIIWIVTNPVVFQELSNSNWNSVCWKWRGYLGGRPSFWDPHLGLWMEKRSSYFLWPSSHPNIDGLGVPCARVTFQPVQQRNSNRTWKTEDARFKRLQEPYVRCPVCCSEYVHHGLFCAIRLRGKFYFSICLSLLFPLAQVEVVLQI